MKITISLKNGKTVKVEVPGNTISSEQLRILVQRAASGDAEKNIAPAVPQSPQFRVTTNGRRYRVEKLIGDVWEPGEDWFGSLCFWMNCYPTEYLCYSSAHAAMRQCIREEAWKRRTTSPWLPIPQ